MCFQAIHELHHNEYSFPSIHHLTALHWALCTKERLQEYPGETLLVNFKGRHEVYFTNCAQNQHNIAGHYVVFSILQSTAFTFLFLKNLSFNLQRLPVLKLLFWTERWNTWQILALRDIEVALNLTVKKMQMLNIHGKGLRWPIAQLKALKQEGDVGEGITATFQMQWFHLQGVLSQETHFHLLDCLCDANTCKTHICWLLDYQLGVSSNLCVFV